MTNTLLHVLVIDDDDVTHETVERCLRRVETRFRVVTAIDGQDGLDVLRGKSDRKLQRPYIILLDLNMPRMNGFEFLETMRADPALRDSIVFVLSTSDSDADRARAYNEFIAGYMVKSALGAQFTKLAQLLQSFSTTVTLPT